MPDPNGSLQTDARSRRTARLHRFARLDDTRRGARRPAQTSCGKRFGGMRIHRRRTHRHDHQGAAPHLGLQNGRTQPPAPRNLGSFGPLLRRFRFAVRPAGHSPAGTVSLLRNVARFTAVHLLRHLLGAHQGAESLRRSLQTDCPLPGEGRGRTPRRDAFRPVRLLHGPRLLLQFAHRLAR